MSRYSRAMLHHLKDALVRAVADTIIQHDGVEHAGYLSFLGLLSFFPFLVFLVAMTGFLGEGELGLQFITWVRNNLPGDVVEALLPRIDEIISGPSQGLLTLSMLAALWTASSAVEGYRTILNRAYRVGTPPAYIWRRLLSIGQLLIFTSFIILGMLVLVLTPLIVRNVGMLLGLPEIYAVLVAWETELRLFSMLLVFMLIAAMYFVLPNIRQGLSDVLPGAIITMAGWAGAVWGLRFYLDNIAQVNIIYGSLGGIIVALLFFYILNVIFIFGAEFNYHLMREHGERIEEKEAAIPEGKRP